LWNYNRTVTFRKNGYAEKGATNEEQKYTSSHYIGKESSCKQLQVAEEISALSIIVCAVLCEQSVDCFVYQSNFYHHDISIHVEVH
jgi:hypothetical protein